MQIAEVQGDDVNGVEKLTGQSSSGKSMYVGPAGWAGRRADFEDAELIGPLYRLSFLFPAAGPQDPVLSALEEVGNVQHRTGARIDSATEQEVEGQKLDLSQAEWIVDVVASDEASAKQLVRDALAPHGEIQEASMTATPLPVG